MKYPDLHKNIKVKELENSEVEITGEISTDIVSTCRPDIIKKLGANINIHGFRKGHIPEKVLVERIGEQAILYETADTVLKGAYSDIIQKNKIHAIGSPEVNITKLAPGNPICFSIKTAILPEVTLPVYKEIARDVLRNKKEDTQVTEKEVDDVIAQILKHKANDDKKLNENDLSSMPADKQTHADNKNEEAVALTDEIARTLGNFKDVDEFKKKLKHDLQAEKVRKEKERIRVEIGEKIIEKSVIPMPRILIESELDKMTAQLKTDIERMGMKFGEYIKQVNKTEEDIRKEFGKDAEKRAKLQLVLNKIAATEKIEVPHDEIDKETSHILSHYKEANPSQVKIYIETMLTNEKVFQMLEKTEK